MKETRSFEVKERVTNTFLKTVSAYAILVTGSSGLALLMMASLLG